MGAGSNVNAFFGIMTMAIAVPTGVKIFNWLFTMYKGNISLKSPMLWFIGFVTTFTIGGVTGVIMAIPPADFQLHNSLFLVAHFHNMVIGGVVFGYFAGITYWFPKIFGFKLNERLGRYAVYCWISGFLFAFVPLYILGLMGATRRLDHYDASLGWQQLFIVSAFGVGLIFMGVGLQILQFFVSIRACHQNEEGEADPWNGRTLEWSVSSPPPPYNFVRLPIVGSIDAFWAAKQSKISLTVEPLKAFKMPTNTGVPLVIASFGFLFGFGMIWHIYWLSIISLLGVITSIIIRANQDEHEYTVSVAELQKGEGVV
jgi:cytochrome o ubiquinol oxidase subunit 1